MVYQMALREGECFLVRRVADRGIEKSIGDSRACGDRLNCDRRSAGRGNEIRNRDPRDIIKIKRLRQRVQDLEEIKRLRQRVRDLEEINRFRQRVRDLELIRERRVRETESRPILRDNVNEEEENPFGRYPPRFYEPTYQECLAENPPKFDTYGIEPDVEECTFVQNVFSGIAIQDDEVMKETDHEFAEVSSGLFDVFNKNAVVDGCAKVTVGCEMVVKSDHHVINLNVSDCIKVSPTKVEIQTGDDYKFDGDSVAINNNFDANLMISKNNLRR
ncbi:hypothetical protein Hanom_Chr06g00579321 [Helianthus anomalus]